jgi:5-formyltetrahydrofolate cyclo-ligase
MDKKNIFREKSKFKIGKLSKVGRIKRDKFIVDKLECLIRKNRYKKILLYLPLDKEVDMMYLIKKIRVKTDIFVPFMEGVSFKMIKFRLPLFRKKFNIKEPNNSFAVNPKIDLAIVPVLGVDGTFKRIGFGKGMYDRFFESLSSSPRVVFVQLVECYTKEFICENHDIRADIYITPYKTIIRRGRDGIRTKYSRFG